MSGILKGNFGIGNRHAPERRSRFFSDGRLSSSVLRLHPPPSSNDVQSRKIPLSLVCSVVPLGAELFRQGYLVAHC